MTSAQKGDGSLFWDNTRQRWVAQSRSATAQRQADRQARSGRTKTAAQRKLKEIIRDYEDGLVIEGYGYTVADAVRDWLAFGLSGRDSEHHHEVHHPGEHAHHPRSGRA